MAQETGVSQWRYSQWHHHVLPRASGKKGEQSLAVWEFQQGRDISKTCREKSQQPLWSWVWRAVTVLDCGVKCSPITPKSEKSFCANVGQTPQSPIQSWNLKTSDEFAAVLYRVITLTMKLCGSANLPKELSVITRNKVTAERTLQIPWRWE